MEGVLEGPRYERIAPTQYIYIYIHIYYVIFIQHNLAMPFHD